MIKMGLNEIREKYLKFFEGKDHLSLPSFSLVPNNDPSILLINAGMTPLKPYFTGQEEPPRKRIATCQKCIRTPDIENVGKTARHGTFFEMLGNFSFGDYFKKEAIAWAWEFVTKDMAIPEDKLYVSVYHEDDEAYNIWNQDIGLAPERIVRLGKKDNFWEHGIGPCGPCSEIYFDRGADKGCGQPECAVGCDCDRYMEFWNLVFTQFNRNEDGTYDQLQKKNIDTGMGLERLACIMQDVNGLFEVDTIRNILDYVCSRTGVIYGSNYKTDVSIRVITDHIRSTTMMVCDGILPSNEGRGYVLRRLLRRAARHGKLLGMEKAFLHEVAQVVVNESGSAYPELVEKADYIKKVIKIEEERFEATVDQGLNILNDFITQTKDGGKVILPGEMIFKLHDTYGFPLDLTREIAEENGLTIDEDGFRREMSIQRQMARDALKSKDKSAWGQESIQGLDKSFKTQFTGYSESSTLTRIAYIIKDGQLAENAQQDDEITLVLESTPFYAESGGQVGDVGVIESKDGKMLVKDCKKTPDGKYLHSGVVTSGIFETGAEVRASVDGTRRMATARNHTVTHLLHKALRNVLGSHVAQSGSLVGPERLRFDFSHFSGMTSEELKAVEKEINDKILDGLDVSIREMPVDEARKEGATALFGEKYGDIVRVVKIGDFSIELCGGIHLSNTAQAGLVKVLGESGVAAGIRRIEASTGYGALAYFMEKEDLLNDVAAALKVAPQDSLRKIEALTADLKNAEKEIEKLRSKLVNSSMDDILSGAIEEKGVKILAAKFDEMDAEALRNTGDMLKNKLSNCVVILASSLSDKVNFVVMASKDAVAQGVHAGNIVREAAKAAGGGGGGRPDMAQAGGKDSTMIGEALQIAVSTAKAQIK